jgi:hypothetical protein
MPVTMTSEEKYACFEDRIGTEMDAFLKALVGAY